jgi:hypothetical protein
VGIKTKPDQKNFNFGGNAMMIQRLIERVQSTKVLTSSLTNQISQLLWKRDYDSKDMEALNQLMDALDLGEIAEK